jgi:hypothetical protein
MRGSDKRVELIIVGVIKGFVDLVEEVGLKLSNLDLSYRCPSCRTLMSENKRLVADGLVVVVTRITRDNTEWIAFMVNHGTWSGTEHVSKSIIWVGRNT